MLLPRRRRDERLACMLACVARKKSRTHSLAKTEVALTLMRNTPWPGPRVRWVLGCPQRRGHIEEQQEGSWGSAALESWPSVRRPWPLSPGDPGQRPTTVRAAHPLAQQVAAETLLAITRVRRCNVTAMLVHRRTRRSLNAAARISPASRLVSTALNAAAETHSETGNAIERLVVARSLR